MTRGKVVSGVLAVVFVLVMVVSVYAQDADAAEGGTTRWSAWDTIKAGGIIGVAIIILSVVAMALIIEHFMSISDDKLIPPDFVAALQANVDEKKFQDAITLCEASDNYLSRIMQVGLSEIPYGYDSMTEAMATVGEEESIKLNQKIGYLSFIGMIAPMLGLLGTVTGMIISFNKIASTPHGVDASELAYGISQALVTTCMGLIVAIPCLFFHSMFQDKVTNIGLEAGAVCEELIRKFKPIKVQGVKLATRKAGPPQPPAGGAPGQSAPKAY